MDINSVLRRFAFFTGLKGDELTECMPYIDDAVVYVGSLVKQNIDVNENSECLSNAAAAYAYYKWSLVNSGNDSTSFSAGDLRITSAKSTNTENSAYRLWLNSLGEIKHLTEDSGFFFRGVKV